MLMAARMRNYGLTRFNWEMVNHPISPIDENHALYGNFIGLQYVFEEALEADDLAKAIAELLAQFPALSGQYNGKNNRVTLSGKVPTLTLRHIEGSISEHVKIGTRWPERSAFVIQPTRKAVFKGQAPLSTFALTTFDNGGCIFGMAINHMLTDASGFHMLAQRLAEIYSALQSGEALPRSPLTTHLKAFEFGSKRTKSQTLEVLKAQGSPKPIPVKGLLGGFVKKMIIKAMETIAENKPVIIRFTAEDIVRLKEAVLTESGEDWISTNTALCAHFTRLMAKLSYGDDIKTTVQLGQLLDLRGRYFEGGRQSDYIGNAILIHIDKAEFDDGLQNTSRGALARYYKTRKTKTKPADVKQRLDLLADCLRHGYSNPGLDIKNPIIALNNQSKMPVYDVSYDGQIPLRIIPQDVGDNIMFFPTPDGGIEIYIRDIVNPHRQQEFLTPEWQAQIFDF